MKERKKESKKDKYVRGNKKEGEEREWANKKE